MNVSNPLTTPESSDDKGDRATHSPQFARLQRAIVKLVFSFHGHHPQLDERLKRLGLVLKSAPKSAAALTLIDEVVDQVVAVDLGRGDTTLAAQQLSELVGQLQFDIEHAADGRSLQRRLQDAASRDDLERLAREAATFLNRQLKPREEPAQPLSAEEPLARLLRSLRLDGDLRIALDALRTKVERARNHGAWLDAADEAAAALSIALATGTARVSPDTLELARQPLLRLLEIMDGGEHPNPELAGARARLGSAASQIELISVARELGDSLKSERMGFERELKELGAFLKTVASRVEEFRGNLRHSGYTHDDSLKSNAWMHSTIQTHMDELRGRVVEEDRIDSLKTVVNEGLGKLEDAFSEHIKVEGERHRNARDHVSVTLRRLSELESEMSQLRSDLEQQHTLSLIDPLTGVYNRMGYMEGVQREFARWKRQGGSLSLAVFDLDHFKVINDRFGHATGDKVLTSLASLLRKHVRGVDLICRFGGEEFVLIMPETDLDGAVTVAEKLRGTVASSQFRFKETPVPVTMSCGIGAFRGDDSIEDVFERADRALYRAKNEGRNRCCIETLD